MLIAGDERLDASARQISLSTCGRLAKYGVHDQSLKYVVDLNLGERVTPGDGRPQKHPSILRKQDFRQHEAHPTCNHGIEDTVVR